MDTVDRITLFTILVVVLLDLLVDLWGAKARRNRATLDELCDEGVILAGQRAKQHDGISGHDKHRIAAQWALDQAKRLRIKTDASEVSRRIEVRLGKAAQP